MADRTVEVLLVSMPFASYKQPSLALSIFKSLLRGRGLETKVLYFTLEFAELIGPWLYEKIATWHLPDLLGDWIFANAVFGESLPNWERYVTEVLNGGCREHSIPHFGKEKVSGYLLEQLLEARAKVRPFISRCVERINEFRPRILGLTSGVHQHVASLALAKEVKERKLQVYVVMGGPNCRGIMGLETVRQFPFVDAVVSGEGEVVFPEVVDRVLSGRPVSGLEGVFSREDMERELVDGSEIAPIVTNLDGLPYPDYSDFIEQRERTGFAKWKGRLLIETSRGCFWGEKVRCIFCGQASPSLRYRSKSPGRVAEELSYLVKSWPRFQVCITDEAIGRPVIEELALRMRGVVDIPDIVYVQVRPNLTKKDVARLAEAGVRRLEAGIETFSSRILRLIRKGTSGIWNIAFLKWCKELGIEVVWNLLWGFPGEPPEAYRAMAEIVPLIFHLDPPKYVGQVRLERFSPMFEKPERFGLSYVRPYPAYNYVYPFGEDIVNNLAYFFTFQYSSRGDASEYTGSLAEIVSLWKEYRSKVFLDVYDGEKQLIIVDGRSPFSPPRKMVLQGLHRLVYLACDEVRKEAELVELVRSKLGGCLADLRNALTELVARGLIIKEGNMYLSLGVLRT